MALVTVQGPDSEPVTRDEAKRHCRIDADLTEDDDLIDSLIATAREHVEGFVHQSLITRTLRLSLDAWPRILYLPGSPVQSVDSIKYTDDAGAEQTLPAEHYQADTDSVPPRIIPAYGFTWPSIRPQMNAVRVQYVAGYGDADAVPEKFKQAMLMLIGHWYENREETLVGSIASEMPVGARALLTPERVWL